MPPIELETHPDGFAVLTIQRPEARNALNWEAMHAFADAIEKTHRMTDLQALILTGVNGAFCAGGDLFELHHYLSRLDGARLAAVMGDALEQLEALPCPTIAALEGPAVGGGAEITLACDLRVMAESAFLGLVHIRLGICPAWGGGQRLLKLVGYSRALEWLAIGRVLSAQDAFELGVANRIAPDGEALKDAIALVEAFAQYDLNAIQNVKRILKAGTTLTVQEAAQFERDVFPDLWAAPAHLDASHRFVTSKKSRKQPASAEERESAG